MGRLEPAEARRRFTAARVARLATVRPSGAPHLVPMTFAADGDRVVSAVDDKPKRSRLLARLDNIAREPRVSLLVDAWDEDWTQLWWVRADGTARIIDSDVDAVRRLQARYQQYVDQPPAGPFVIVDVDRWIGWSAATT
jgi:PPOX class probable F420-dependent enzyme